MGARADRLRAAVAALGRTRRNEAIPLALRAELIAHAREARSRGEGWGAIAGALGVSATGLQRWLATAARHRAPQLRRVQLTAAPAPASALCVLSPSGYRVEGLGVAEAAALLRALA